MRKRVLASTISDPPLEVAGWLELDRIAEVDLTSEDAEHPIESALRRGGTGWRAAEPGTQVIRLHFDAPQRLRRIQLVFVERQTARTQEFVLRWRADEGEPFREVVRQRYNFSPLGATREVEDYTVDLDRVTALELSIIPDVGGQECRASLASWGLA